MNRVRRVRRIGFAKPGTCPRTYPAAMGRRRALRLAAVLLVGVAGVGAVRAATVSVDAVNFRYLPQQRIIAAGDTVRWTFAGEPHTVTSGAPGAADGRFDSGIVEAGATFSLRFDTPGSFPYFCEIHPEDMVGIVEVTAAATPRPTPRPTPAPTPRPTPAPTPRPTPAPTPRPTATATPRRTPTPAPTSRATSTPTARPTATPSPSPSGSPSPATASTPAAATASLTISPSPGAPSASPGATDVGGAPGSDDGDAPATASGGAGLPLVALAVVAAIAAAALTLGIRRARSGP